jgi:thioredoxin-like negative regulator of GroEL
MYRVTVFAAALLLVASCGKEPETAGYVESAKTANEIAWLHPATMTEVDRAFEQAKIRHQPVFLFWTAVWCPPCNQVKSTIFTRPEFIAKSRLFVPVYVDADSPGGQALGARFKVSGYPTMVLLDSDGREVTRLAGSVDAAKYMQLLDRGLAGGPSAKQSLEIALAGHDLPADDWRMLAFYSWETDEGQLVPENEVASTLLKLASTCPAELRESSSRLVLQALLASAQTKNATPKLDKSDAIESVTSLLAQPQLARDNNDLLGYGADDVVGLLTVPGSKERAELTARWNAALDRLAADATLSNNGRMYAILGKVLLARLDNKRGALSPELVEIVRTQAVRVDQETTDLDERQAVITLAGAVLAEAGLIDESDALLKAELKRSHSPYYYMSQLASNAKRRGTPDGNSAAIDWSHQAYERAEGSATRLRWGGSYVAMLIALAPQDSATIERTSMQIIGETDPGSLTGNNRLGLERLSKRLVAWNKSGQHDDVLARLNASMRAKCAGASAHAWCDGLFQSAGRA